MRFLISRSFKKKLLISLKEKYNCVDLSELSQKLLINKKTLEGWFYIPGRCLPEDFIKYHGFESYVESKRENNWGQVSGGKIGYQTVLKTHGLVNMKKFQSLGGKNSSIVKEKIRPKLNIQITDPKFLELYGAILGDGWLCNPNNKNSRWVIGLCGHLNFDKGYLEYLAKNIGKLINRKGGFCRREKSRVLEFRFRHKEFFNLLNKELEFPAGKKENLKIPSKLFYLGYEKTKYIIRGIFDTDGSFYLDKNRKGVPSYPVISIHMNEPLLIKQMGGVLLNEGFRLSYSNNGNMIKLKGHLQLAKWMREIGTSNPHKLSLMKAVNSV